jgi:hypothetical protein
MAGQSASQANEGIGRQQPMNAAQIDRPRTQSGSPSLSWGPGSGLIESKLYAPRLSSHHVPRPRLIEQLNSGLTQPLTLVCATGGSGKSAALSEWQSVVCMPTAWISLDEGDNDPAVFLSYIVAAIHN